MSRERYKPAQFINLFRGAVVALSRGQTGRRNLPHAGDLGPELRGELINGEVFCTLKEARVLIERWKHHDNMVRTSQFSALLGGVVRGAVLGAIGGAIDGDVGPGAAIDEAVGRTRSGASISSKMSISDS